MKTLATLSFTLLASTAFADVSPRETPAVRNALEIAVAATLAEGAGDLGGGMQSFDDAAEAGMGVDIAVGYRVSPRFAIGGYLNGTGYGDHDDSSKGAVTFAAGIKADWHFKPAAKWDPWVSLGTGVKMMAIEHGDEEQVLTGLELGRLQVGYDYRVSSRFAIGPTLGVSATMYRNTHDEDDNTMAIDDKRVNWTITAGVLGRFDAFGTTR